MPCQAVLGPLVTRVGFASKAVLIPSPNAHSFAAVKARVVCAFSIAVLSSHLGFSNLHRFLDLGPQNVL